MKSLPWNMLNSNKEHKLFRKRCWKKGDTVDKSSKKSDNRKFQHPKKSENELVENAVIEDMIKNIK